MCNYPSYRLVFGLNTDQSLVVITNLILSNKLKTSTTMLLIGPIGKVPVTYKTAKRRNKEILYQLRTFLVV